MKSMKTFCIGVLTAFAAVALTGCELFGLSYAYDYKQEHGADFGTLSCDAMAWIEEHKGGEFALQYEAIVRSGMEAVYRDSVYTFFVMKDDVWDAWLTSYKYSSIAEVPVKTLRTYLQRSIIPGKYLSTDISAPVFVETLDPTVTMRLYKTIVSATSSQNLNGLRAGWTNDNGKINQVSMITSNLQPTNGALHVQAARFTFLQ